VLVPHVIVGYWQYTPLTACFSRSELRGNDGYTSTVATVGKRYVSKLNSTGLYRYLITEEMVTHILAIYVQ
jgi:hypothetical protein